MLFLTAGQWKRSLDLKTKFPHYHTIPCSKIDQTRQSHRKTEDCDWLHVVYDLTMKWIGMPGESGVCVTSLSSVIQRKGVGESLGARMSHEKSGIEDASEPSVL